LAHALEVPFAAGDSRGLVRAKKGSVDVSPLLLGLLQASDFDVEAAQQGVVFVDGAERLEVRAALLRLWQENICHPVEGLQLAAHGILFVCGGTFVGLDEAITRLGRHSEQSVTVAGLTALGVQPDWAGCLAGIARVAPLDEESLARMAHWVDFRRIDRGPAEPGAAPDRGGR
jgi:ATP-dependent Clp protease ATP-binding subunit ClpX